MSSIQPVSSFLSRFHSIQFQEFKQKLKQLEAEHHSEIFGRKMAVVAATSQTRNKLLESELELLGKVQNFQTDKREMELGAQLQVWKLKQVRTWLCLVSTVTKPRHDKRLVSNRNIGMS